MNDGKNNALITEDYDFIDMTQKVVKWNPLTDDGRNYRSPYIEYSFYLDVLYRFNSFVQFAKDAGAVSRALVTAPEFNGKNYIFY